MRIPVEELITRFQQNLFAVAFNVCGDREEAEDVVQEAFIQYHLTDKEFDSEAHCCAWLIRVTINKAKNVTRTFWRRNRVSLAEQMAQMPQMPFVDGESEALFAAVMALPQKYRVVVHLFYYEDYSVREIAEILQISEANVKKRLSRARKMLRDALKEGWSDDE